MNTIQIKMILLIGLLLSVLSACEKDVSTNDSFTITEMEQIVETGSWVITNFNDSGKDETYHFNGYHFSFKDDGVLESTNGVNIYVGLWNISHDSSDDSSTSDVDFNIYFDSTNDAFEELTEDWEIISNSSTKIELIHISGGNGGTDYLTFERV